MSNKVVFDERLSQLEDVNFVCNYLRCSENRIYVDAPGLCHTVNDWNGTVIGGAGRIGIARIEGCDDLFDFGSYQ